MRIGVLTTSYPRAPGDPAGSFVGGLARWLAARGHRVEVIAAAPGALRDGEVAVERVRAGAGLFYGEGAPDRLERSPRWLPSAPLFSAALLARARARARGWDRVVSHWLLPCGVAGAALGLPQLAIAHSADVHLLARPLCADAVAAALVASRTRTVFVADHLRDRLLAAVRLPRLRRALRERSAICPMGIDPPARRDRAAARARLGLAPGTRAVAFLGRLVPIKGAATLIDAVGRLPGVVLLVGGDGPLRDALPRPPGVRFLGELRGDARDDLYAAADVLALPSLELPGGRTEGAPGVLVEGLAAGLPVVASDLPGIRATAGGAARLVPPGDPGALAAALADLLEHGDAAAVGLGQKVAARRTWDAIGPRLESMLGSL